MRSSAIAAFLLFLILLQGCIGWSGAAQCEVMTGGFSYCRGSISGRTVTLDVPEMGRYAGDTSIREVDARECTRAGEGILICEARVPCQPVKQTNPFSATCEFKSGRTYAVVFKLGLTGTGPEESVPADLSCAQMGGEEELVRWDCEISYFRVSGQA